MNTVGLTIKQKSKNMNKQVAYSYENGQKYTNMRRWINSTVSNYFKQYPRSRYNFVFRQAYNAVIGTKMLIYLCSV